MYRSVGKLLRSLTTTVRLGSAARCSASAADNTLNRLTLVESATTSSPGPTPTSGAILSPMRCGSAIQPAVFQLPIRPWPHSCATTWATRAAVAARQHAQRIAVQVDQALGDVELLAQRRQGVGGVRRQGVVTGGHGRGFQRARSTARTGDASAAISFSGRAISS